MLVFLSNYLDIRGFSAGNLIVRAQLKSLQTIIFRLFDRFSNCHVENLACLEKLDKLHQVHNFVRAL